MSRAVILGAGLGGLLSAAALGSAVDEIVMIEQDELPDSPKPRRALPQSVHNHMLLGGGAEAIDQLLPGTVEALYAAGAHRRSYLDTILIRTASAWGRRMPIDAYAITCSRDLIDHVVRQQVFGGVKVHLIERATVTGLDGDGTRVRGVTFERAGGGPVETLAADLVIDATGQRSKAPEWLAALGVGEVREDYVDAGHAYSRRVYEAPPGFRDDFPGILIQPKHGTGLPGVGGALMPNEDGRWMVVMIGTRGAVPPTDEEGFLRFARGEWTRVIADLIEHARPLTPVRAYRDLTSRWRHFEKVRMPAGLVVLGDAAIRVNPTYATGMTGVARSAVLLRDEVAARGIDDPKFTRRMQAGIAKIGAGPWQLATSSDHWFPDVRTNQKRQGGKGMLRFTARYTLVSTEDQKVGEAVYRVAAQLAPPTEVMKLPLMLSVIRGPRQGPLTADQAIRQYPALAELLDRPRSALPPEPAVAVVLDAPAADSPSSLSEPAAEPA